MIYLDNAATSFPKPQEVVQAVLRAFDEIGGNPGRSGHRLSLAAAEAVYDARVTVARHIGATDETHIVFFPNATYAINTVLRARVRPGNHILISDLEHNSVRRPVLHLGKEGHYTTYSIFSHKGDVLENIRREIRPNTAILICTHVSNVFGTTLPIEEIGALCREKGIFFIVDASQSMGHRALDVERIDCDALCAPGHKGLLGMQGSGFLYVRGADGLIDTYQGGSGSNSMSPYMPEELPDKLEPGTLSTPAILSLAAGIRWIEEHGLDEIEAKEQELSRRYHERLGNMKGVTLLSIPQSGIIAFRVDGMTSEEVAAQLDRVAICVRGGYHCAPLAHQARGTLDGGVIRLSCGVFNSFGEVEVFSHQMEQLIKNKR